MILGLSYKDNSDDLRDAPSIEIFKKPVRKRKNIYVSDPNVDKKIIMNNFKGAKNITIHSLNKNFLSNIDLVVLLNKHKKINYKSIQLKSKLILDCKNIYKKIQKCFNSLTMNILVIGNSGLIGNALVQKLIKKQIRLICYDISKPKYSSEILLHKRLD